MTEKKSKPKLGMSRTEVFAMRLDPKLKYLAEISARRQRRSLANFIEWAIEQALREVTLNPIGQSPKHPVTAADRAEELWSPDEATRLLNLAALYPDLLTYEERLIWDVICEYSTRIKGTTKRLRFREDGVINNHAVRSCWTVIKPFALGTATSEQMDEILDTYNWVQVNQLEDNGDKRG